MSLINRIKHLIKSNDLSASAFADKIGVQRSSISHILSGRNKPSLEFVEKVLSQFPNISADWLIKGETEINPSLIQKTDALERVLPPPSSLTDKDKRIKKIVIFYSDHTFEEIIKEN